MSPDGREYVMKFDVNSRKRKETRHDELGNRMSVPRGHMRNFSSYFVCSIVLLKIKNISKCNNYKCIIVKNLQGGLNSVVMFLPIIAPTTTIGKCTNKMMEATN